jgi:hypothetical protein
MKTYRCAICKKEDSNKSIIDYCCKIQVTISDKDGNKMTYLGSKYLENNPNIQIKCKKEELTTKEIKQ